MRLVVANTATATKRRVYFHLVDVTDGITAETGEAGGQPQISTNGGAFTNTGIGTLTAIGNGRYYADLTQAAVATSGDIIETRYKSGNTAECPGDTAQVVAFDLDSATNLGLSNITDILTDTAEIGAAGAGLTNINLPDQTMNITGDITGNLSGSVGSVTGAVGSVTGNVGGNVTGSVGSVAAGGITASSIAADAIGASELAADAVAEIADAIWDEARAGHVAAGSFGEGVASVQGNVTGSVASVTGAVGSVTGNVGGNVAGSVASVTGAVGSVTGNVGGNVVGSVASVTGAVGSVTGSVGGDVTGSVGSLAAQAKADVNAEVLDVLNVDTFAEPTSAPAATSTLRAKIGWIFKLLRNKRTQTATTETLYADDGTTADSTSTKSDDTTTFTRGEWT